MIPIIHKYAHLTSILLLLALVIALFFSTPSARLLSIIIIVFGIGTTILFAIHSNWETKQNDELTTAQFTRNSIIDLLGLALVMGTAVWLGKLTGTYIGLAWAISLGLSLQWLWALSRLFLLGRSGAKSQNR